MDNIFKIEDAIRRLEEMALDKDNPFGIYPGASDDVIERFEKKMGVKLPDDFRKFYKFTDGTTADEYMFRIIPLGEIMENSEQEGFQTAPGQEFDFAEYMIYSDTWTLNIDKNNHNNYIIGTRGRIDYTNSLVEFLVRYIDGGLYEGLLEWENEIKRNRLS